jgi:hypothetical protein
VGAVTGFNPVCDVQFVHALPICLGRKLDEALPGRVLVDLEILGNQRTSRLSALALAAVDRGMLIVRAAADADKNSALGEVFLPGFAFWRVASSAVFDDGIFDAGELVVAKLPKQFDGDEFIEVRSPVSDDPPESYILTHYEPPSER